tara:strand:+ start:6997 stop:8547 length:1551 start_codon:yes stop_codon:yes gene_type:complete
VNNRLKMTARAPPRGVIYGALPPAGALATRRLVQFMPTTDAEYTYSGQNTFTIPINGPFWLDADQSYLSFDLVVEGKYTANAGGSIPCAFMNSSVHNVFNQLEILGPSENRIEHIPFYNQIAATIHDARAGGEDDLASGGKGTGLIAARHGLGQTDGAGNGVGIIAPFNEEFTDTMIVQDALAQDSTSAAITEGFIFSNPSTAVSSAAFVQLGKDTRCTVKLEAGTLKTGKYIPLISMVGKGLQLRLQLENPNQVFSGFSAAAANRPAQLDDVQYTVKNVRFFASVVSMDDSINRQFLDILSSQQLVQAHTESYLYSVRALTLQTNQEALFNINARSLNSVIAWTTPTEAWNNRNVDGIGFRYRDCLNSFQFRVNGVNYPESRVELLTVNNDAGNASDLACGSVYGTARAFQEFRKAMGTYKYHDKASRDTITAFGKSGFYMAQCLKAYPHDFSVIESGIDTATSATPIYLSMERATCINGYSLASAIWNDNYLNMMGICDMIVSYQFNGTAVASI